MKTLKYILIIGIINMTSLVQANPLPFVYYILEAALQIYGSMQHTGSLPPSNQIRSECEKYVPPLNTICISEECLRGLPACYALEDMNKIYRDIYGTWPTPEVTEAFISTYIYQGATDALYQFRLPAIHSLYRTLYNKDATFEQVSLAQKELGTLSNWHPFAGFKAGTINQAVLAVYQEVHREAPTEAQFAWIRNHFDNGLSYDQVKEQVITQGIYDVYKDIYGREPTQIELAETRATFANGLSYAEVRAKIEAMRLVTLKKTGALQFLLSQYMVSGF